MSNHQTLEQTLQTMVDVLETVKAGDLPLDRMMDEFLRGVEAYQKFEMHVANETLDVKEMKPGETSTFKESDFEWKNM